MTTSTTRVDVAQKRAHFRALHQQGCFVLPNPWDVGSARMLQALGFSALASTSAGFAWTQGREDNRVTLESVLEHLKALCPAVDLPVNADFESGFATEPEGVAKNVLRAVDAGVSGLSVEDWDLRESGKLYERSLAVERIRVASKALRDSGTGAVLVSRTETLLQDPKAVSAAIDRLVAFADAGADCLYAPGVSEKADIAAMVKAVAPKPLNVLVLRPGLSVQELADLGVRRVSVGGALARVAFGALRTAAEQLKTGSFDWLASGMPGRDLNATFAKFGADK